LGLNSIHKEKGKIAFDEMESFTKPPDIEKPSSDFFLFE
jgi:hypothetical protein